MKKFLTILLTVVFIGSVALTGCSTSTTDTDVDTEDQKETVVGFVYIGPIGDGGWTYAHDLGRLALEEELGVKTIFKESVPESQESEQVMRDMIDQGASIIFATSFGYMDFVTKVAKEYPEVTFFHCSGNQPAENVATYFGRMYEPRYLSGIVAGLKTEVNEIGYVAAFPYPEVIRGINAFALGVQSVNPDAVVNVTYTSTWYDPAKEKAAAVALLDQGVDVIAQHQDTAGPQQAAEERGVWSIGYDSDMYDMAPGSYMTAPVWNWGAYYVEQVQAVMDGNFESHEAWNGLADGIVELVTLTENAPAEAQALVDEVQGQIIDGSFNVFAGPLYDNEGNLRVAEGETMTDAEMLGMDWLIKGVEGKVE